MSSGFVSGGTADAPIQRSDEWLAAQQELEANRRRKAEQDRQNDGRSLFDTLQANKAAKEEAFQEAAKLKNQFRALDDDEIEYLDSVLESTRAEEDRVKKETAEGLAAFRKQQDEAEKRAREDSELAVSPVDEVDTWAAGPARKRKRMNQKEGLKGVKLRRVSTNERSPSKEEEESASKEETDDGVKATAMSGIGSKETQSSTTKLGVTNKEAAATIPAKGGLGLVSYGSDSDDE